MSCELCDTNGGTPIWRDARCRVVLVDEPGYPGFCRVIWNSHVKEMTDLEEADRAYLMRTVFGVEKVLRELLQPDKVNLASLGNAVPHLHWHVIPRYCDDSHFPNPIWGSSLRPPRPANTTGIPNALANRMVGLQTEIGKT